MSNDLKQRYDAIVIGGGHNGLVCANYLAKAGKSVLVIERRDILGGAAVTEEIAPGFRSSTFSYLMAWLHPKIIRDFNLKKYGLKVLPCSSMFSPLDSGDYITFSEDVKRTQESFARFSRKDAEIYPEFDCYLSDSVAIFRKMLWETPIDPSRRDVKGLLRNASFAWRHRKIGKKMYRVWDLLTMSADAFLSEWFEDSRIKAVLAYYSAIGTFAGPMQPGSAYVIIHHMMGEHEGAGGWGFIEGGMGKISDALATYGRSVGVTYLTGAEITEIRVRDGRATGVSTSEGKDFFTDLVVSNASAKQMYLDMLDPLHVPDEVLREARGYRTFSSAFKMNVACERLPQWEFIKKARADGALGNEEYPSYMHVAPDVEYLEKAYDDAKYGWYSSAPFLTPVSPTTVDRTLAPENSHIVNFFGGHASYELRESGWERERENFRKNVFDTIHRFAPDFENDVIEAQFLLPPDMEKIVNLPQGHIFHGELSPDQLFFQRPVSGYADYRTPVKGLYVCGSSMHPGGGVSGLPGHNAAREILRDMRTRI